MLPRALALTMLVGCAAKSDGRSPASATPMSELSGPSTTDDSDLWCGESLLLGFSIDPGQWELRDLEDDEKLIGIAYVGCWMGSEQLRDAHRHVRYENYVFFGGSHRILPHVRDVVEGRQARIKLQRVEPTRASREAFLRPDHVGERAAEAGCHDCKLHHYRIHERVYEICELDNRAFSFPEPEFVEDGSDLLCWTDQIEGGSYIATAYAEHCSGEERSGDAAECNESTTASPCAQGEYRRIHQLQEGTDPTPEEATMRPFQNDRAQSRDEWFTRARDGWYYTIANAEYEKRELGEHLDTRPPRDPDTPIPYTKARGRAGAECLTPDAP